MTRRSLITAVIASIAFVSLGALAASQLYLSGRIARGQRVATVPGADYTVPYFISPTQAQFDQCERININSAMSWGINGDAFVIGYDASSALDNWIILPSVQIEPGNYKFSCEYKTRSMTEDFQVYLLSTPSIEESARTMTLLSVSDYKNVDAYVTGEKDFLITESGIYYVALHASSPANHHGIYVRNFSIVSNESEQPVAPVVTSFSKDGLDGTFTVMLPAKNASGDNLTASIVNLNITVDGASMPVLSGAPGSSVTFAHTYTSGAHTVIFTAWIEAGGQRLESEPVSYPIEMHTKCPVPMQLPVNFTPTEDEYSWCTVLDQNNDGTTWGYVGSATFFNGPAGAAFYYRYSSSYVADDWLVLPAIYFPAPGLYELSFDVATRNRTENLEVAVATGNDIADFYANRVATYTDFSTKVQWETKVINVQATQAGDYYVAFHANSPRNQDCIFLKEIKVSQGNGAIPLMPELTGINFDGGDGTLTAKLPTKAYDGSALTGTLTAHFCVDNGNLLNATGAPGSEVSVNVTGLEKGSHEASVYVSYTTQGMVVDSEKAYGTFIVTSPSSLRYTLPMNENLASIFADCTVLDANNDGYSWSVYGDEVMYTNSSHSEANDWIFTRPVTVSQADADYLLTLALQARTYVSAGSFEVWLGTAPQVDAMTHQLIDVQNTSNSTLTTFDSEFSLPAGDYVIGIHAIKSNALGYIFMKDLSFKATSKPAVTPGVVTDLYADPDMTGALQATVSFKFPTLSAKGTELAADSELTALVSCGSNTASVTGTPGESASVVVATEQGDNVISVVVSNELGAGLSASTTVHCGLDIPTTPRVLSTIVSEDNYSVTVRWRAVTTGVNDGIVNEDGMRYRIFLYDYDSQMWNQIEDTDALTYTYTVPASVDYLDTYLIGIQAYNGPESVSPEVATANAVLGRPYDLPINETFAQSELHYGPVSLFSTQVSNYAPTWYVGNPADLNSSAATSDGSALIGHTEYSSGDTQVELPKFSTVITTAESAQGVDGVDLSLDIFISSYTPAMSFVGYYAGIENSPVTIATLDTSFTTGWATVTYALPQELLGKTWVAVRDMVDFSRGSNDWALIDAYRLTKHGATSVASMQAHSSVVAGRGAVTFTGFEGKTVSIASIDGAISGQRLIPAAQHSVLLPAGVYVITCDGNTWKVIVK